MEIYIDDILVKIKEYDSLFFDLQAIFNCLHQHNMRLIS